MRDRIYEGEINGVKYRYSVMIGAHDPKVSYEAAMLHDADRRFMAAFFAELTKRGIINVRHEEYEW